VESVRLEKEVRKSLGTLNYVEWLDRDDNWWAVTLQRGFDITKAE